MPKTPREEDKTVNLKEEISSFDPDDGEEEEGKVARTLFQENIEKDNQTELRQRHDYEEEKKEVLDEYASDDESSETDSDQENQSSSLRHRMKKGKKKRQRRNSSDDEEGSESSDEGNFDFKMDNLIERPGQFFSSLLTQIDKKSQKLIHGAQAMTGSNMSNNMESGSDSMQNEQTTKASQIDSSSKYVNELENVLLFVIAETVMDDFKEEATDEPDFQLLLQSLIMPFFQLRTRILEKNTYFEIGNIQFFVAATSPHEFGKITTNSVVRLLQSVNRS